MEFSHPIPILNGKLVYEAYESHLNDAMHGLRETKEMLEMMKKIMMNKLNDSQLEKQL